MKPMTAVDKTTGAMLLRKVLTTAAASCKREANRQQEAKESRWIRKKADTAKTATETAKRTLKKGPSKPDRGSPLLIGNGRNGKGTQRADAENLAKPALKGIERPGKIDGRAKKQTGNVSHRRTSDGSNAHGCDAIAANLVGDIGEAIPGGAVRRLGDARSAAEAAKGIAAQPGGHHEVKREIGPDPIEDLVLLVKAAKREGELVAARIEGPGMIRRAEHGVVVERQNAAGSDKLAGFPGGKLHGKRRQHELTAEAEKRQAGKRRREEVTGRANRVWRTRAAGLR